MDYILMVAFVIMLILVTIVDIKRMEIPNKFIIAIGVIAIVAMFFQDNLAFTNRLIGFFCISLPLLIISIIVPGAFGGGDIKLMAVSGLYLGVWLTLLSFVIGAIVGSIYGVWLLFVKKKGKKEHFAFGPFLCIGMVIALFFGEQVISWYQGVFL
jgi:leader peptidase (prepilin peptidase)/N-methyltransferase